MECCLVMMLLYGDIICDEFHIIFSDSFIVIVIQTQLSIIWEMYVDCLQGKCVHMWVWFRRIMYTFIHMFNQGLEWQHLISMKNNIWSGIFISGCALMWCDMFSLVILKLLWYNVSSSSSLLFCLHHQDNANNEDRNANKNTKNRLQAREKHLHRGKSQKTYLLIEIQGSLPRPLIKTTHKVISLPPKQQWFSL